MLPVIARNVLESIRLLANVSRVFADRCIAGIEANAERCREYAESSPSIVTPLNHYVGYDEAAKIAKQALAERKTIREVVIERGHVAGQITEEQLDKVLDVLSMTRPKAWPGPGGSPPHGARRAPRSARSSRSASPAPPSAGGTARSSAAARVAGRAHRRVIAPAAGPPQRSQNRRSRSHQSFFASALIGIFRSASSVEVLARPARPSVVR